MALWQAMPPSLLLQALLVPGGAFSAEYEYFGEGRKKRVFFVVNRAPTADARIFILTATTQIKKREAHHGSRAKDVLVYLSPDHCPGIIKPSVIDCDSLLIRRTRHDFDADAARKAYEPLGQLSSEIMSRICACVAAAKTLSAVEKRVIIGSEPDGFA